MLRTYVSRQLGVYSQTAGQGDLALAFTMTLDKLFSWPIRPETSKYVWLAYAASFSLTFIFADPKTYILDIGILN
jgi:hypothetical protein